MPDRQESASSEKPKEGESEEPRSRIKRTVEFFDSTTKVLIAVGALIAAVTGVWVAVNHLKSSVVSANPAHQPTFQGSPTVAPSAGGVPVAYQGSWQGYIVYGGTSNSVNMMLGNGANGAQVGNFMNSALGCNRQVYLEGGGGPVFLRLILAPGQTGQCVPVMYARVTLTPAGLSIVMEDNSEMRRSGVRFPNAAQEPPMFAGLRPASR
jgi:hypothetical protein